MMMMMMMMMMTTTTTMITTMMTRWTQLPFQTFTSGTECYRFNIQLNLQERTTAYNCNIILISTITDRINILMLHTPSVFAVFLPKLFIAAGRKGTINAPSVALPCLEGSLQIRISDWLTPSRFSAMRMSIMWCTGLFISPSRISELDCATTTTDTAERSISIHRESLQVLFVLGALVYFQVPLLGGSRDEKWRSQWIRKH